MASGCLPRITKCCSLAQRPRRPLLPRAPVRHKATIGEAGRRRGSPLKGSAGGQRASSITAATESGRHSRNSSGAGRREYHLGSRRLSRAPPTWERCGKRARPGRGGKSQPREQPSSSAAITHLGRQQNAHVEMHFHILKPTSKRNNAASQYKILLAIPAAISCCNSFRARGQVALKHHYRQ